MAFGLPLICLIFGLHGKAAWAADIIAGPNGQAAAVAPATDLTQTCINNLRKPTIAKPPPVACDAPSASPPSFTKVTDTSQLPSANCQIADPKHPRPGLGSQYKYFSELKKALKNQIKDCGKKRCLPGLKLGDTTSPRQQWCGDTNRLMLCLANNTSDFSDFMSKVKSNFDWYKNNGLSADSPDSPKLKKGDFEFTSYKAVSPLDAKHPPCNDQYPYTLYRTPRNLLDPSSDTPHSCGVDPITGSVRKYCLQQADGSFIPVPDRAAIDSGNGLTGLKGTPDQGGSSLALACVKSSVDAAFLMNEGSGSIHFTDSGQAVKINYSDQNGARGVSLSSIVQCEEWNGSYNTDGSMNLSMINRADLNESGIRNYLSKLDSESLTRTLNYNKSYVFFKMDDGGPYGSNDIPISPMASIATDRSMIPTGTVALISTKRPAGLPGQCDSMTFMAVSQDSGGAINGAHADIYSGQGKTADDMAAHFVQPGSLFVAVPNGAGQAYLKSNCQ